jgi:alkylation response protein AidB-like acyl-CoA dehydrogenase
MDFAFSEEQRDFRQEVVDFCRKPPEYTIADLTEEAYFSPEYYRELAAKGWIGLHWPRQYGGQGRSWVDLAIFNDEMGYHRVPMGDIYYGTVGLFGDFCCSYGSEEQKMDYLPRITSGKIRFARAYTEPDAGYDLTSIQTSARRDGDGYIISGQKRFITGANVADYLFLMARTDMDAPKGKGLTFFVVDVKTPGITMSPIWSVALRTNEVFLDDVRVSERNVIGEKGMALDYIDNDPHFRYETSLGFDLGMTRRLFERVVRHAREDEKRLSTKRARVRQQLAEIAIDVELSRLMTYRVAWMRSSGLLPQCEVYMQKLCQAQLEQKLADVAMEMLGLLGTLELGAKYAPMRGFISINSRISLISFLPGSPEILRNAIAGKGLGLTG